MHLLNRAISIAKLAHANQKDKAGADYIHHPMRVMNALRCLTKLSEEEPYEQFIDRVKSNPLAIAVKLNDISDNMDIRRPPEMTDNDVIRLCKYLQAYHDLKIYYSSK